MNPETEQIFLLNLSEAAIQKADQANIENVEDFSSVCRTCTTVTALLIPIFSGEGLQNNLAEKINKHLPIQVTEEDELPHALCYQCAHTLFAWHELVTCCEQADVALKTRLAGMRQNQDGKQLRSDDTTTPENDQPKEFKPCGFNAIASADTKGNNNELIKIQIDAPSENEDNLSDETTDSITDDDQPLSTIATKKSLYNNFYKALVNFRNHFLGEHKTEDNYLDLTDSSDSELVAENNDDLDVNDYDDLTQSNMRKDRMDEETRIELSQVQTKINGKVFYTCTICGKNLSSPHTYVFHKRIHTGERPCVCHICGKQFRAPNGLQRHLTETHEKVRRHSCRYCPKNFANSQNLKQHMRIHTGERPFVCSQCGKRFTQSGSLHVHLKTHSELFPFQCAECGAKFRLRSGLSRHKLKHTGERPHVCVHCGKGFRQKHELNSHTLSHTDSKPFICVLCGAAFRQRRALTHHTKRLHENDQTREVANTVTARAPNMVLYTHIGQYQKTFIEIEVKIEDTSHEPKRVDGERIEPPTVTVADGKKYAECNFCKKVITLASWRRHVRSHRGEKRYSCHTCGLSFRDSGNLARHSRALHDRHRPHTCSLCQKTFSRNSHLKDHLKSHSESREYICDVCGKASKSSAALRMHKKTHESECKFECMECGARFKRRGELRAHVSVHTGERAHVCACGRAFRLAGQLSAHARTHKAPED